MPDPETPDTVNRPVWDAAAGEFAVDGWLDPAETVALPTWASKARGLRLLDVGVGAGRTTALLRLVSDDYTGLDYSPEMVALARARHPGVNFTLGDARALQAGDDHWDAAYFSNNGIDAVDHAGRAEVLAGLHRTLRPGGWLLLTTLNKDSGMFGCTPGGVPPLTWSSGLMREAADTPDEAGDDRFARSILNWRRLRRFTEDHGEWGISPLPAHDFGLLVHYVTLAGAKAELAGHGFDVQATWACGDREPLPGAATTSAALYFYLLARALP